MENIAKTSVGATILFVVLWQFRTVLELILGIPVNTLYYSISIIVITILVAVIWHNLE